MTRKLLAAALIAVTTVACGSDDGGSGPPPQHELVGTWQATGEAGVSPGLYNGFNIRSITATFNANQTYTVVSTDAANAQVTYTGTWQADQGTNGTIRAITLNQATPSAVTSQGIFRVTGTSLTYEVIQVQPALAGFLPPTVQGGFGSTSFNGAPLGAMWTQNYTKQP